MPNLTTSGLAGVDSLVAIAPLFGQINVSIDGIGDDYAKVRGLSVEVQQKLNRHRPQTLGQASRISGVTPAAISVLLVHLKRGFAGAREGARLEEEKSRRAAGESA